MKGKTKEMSDRALFRALGIFERLERQRLGSHLDTRARLKKRIPHDLDNLLATLPEGRRRVAEALIDGREARTYPEVADMLDVHLGTVHQHLRRIRLLHPEVYAALMAERARQLAKRHEEALARAEMHTRQWLRRKANCRYYLKHGHWPWERHAYAGSRR